MAKAPKTRKEQEPARVAIQISCRDADGSPVEKSLYLSDLGPQDDLVARKQTGFPVTPFLEQEAFGADSLLILWWMARRKDGEGDLRFDEVLAEFPSYQSLNDADFKVEAVEEDAVEDAGPLPSAGD